MLELETIYNDTIYEVHYSNLICKYEHKSDIDYGNMPVSINRTKEQPKHLQKFYTLYDKYISEFDKISIEEFYNKFYKEINYDDNIS